MKRFLVLSCSVAISALFFHACSSSDDSMIDAPLTRADAVSEKIVFQDDFNQADSIPDRNKWSLCKKGSPPGANIYPKAMIRLMYTMEN